MHATFVGSDYGGCITLQTLDQDLGFRRIMMPFEDLHTHINEHQTDDIQIIFQNFTSHLSVIEGAS